MPNADEGTVTAGTETGAPATTTEATLEGFSASMIGNVEPEGVVSGHPEAAEAVETSAEVEAPEAKTADTPAAKPEPAKAEDKPDPTKTVNFDGFSDKQKTTWTRLLKDGHATPDEVEAARKDALRQDLFSKKTKTLADERDAFEKEKAAWGEDYALLQKIRASDALHARWLKMNEPAPASDDPEADAPITRREAEQIADERDARRERERAERSGKEQADYDKRKNAMGEAVRDTMRTLGLDKTAMKSYLDAEEATLEGADPILALRPSELQRRVELRHEAETAKAELAKAREQVSQRTSQQARASKQSLPPARREADARPMDALRQTEADLGIAPDWSNVQGFGFRNGQH